ncbi:uncharacterized protein V3H82_003184 [Fundulus diaphanus]
MRIYFTATALWQYLMVTGSNGAPLNTTCNRATVDHTAYVGGSVSITCNYSQADKSSTRNFCRHDGNFSCTNIISAQRSDYTKLPRVTLSDDKQRGVYTVTISTLTQDDSGKYRCALKREDSFTCLQDILLDVLNLDDFKPIIMSHAEKETAQIRCSYPKSEKNSEKSLCKGESPSDCDEIISSTEENRTVKKGNFDLRDNRRLNHFYVYINNLHKSDSGTYWCGYGGTKHIRIQLSVAEARTKVGPLPTQPEQLTALPKARKTEISRDTERSDYGIIAGIACAVLIVVVTVVVVLSRQKLFNRQGGGSEQKKNETNDGEHQYEAIPMQNKEESADQTLYSTVNQPAEQLNYASIKILNSGSTVADEDKNGSSASKSNPKGVAHPPTVTTVYSTIGKLRE